MSLLKASFVFDYDCMYYAVMFYLINSYHHALGNRKSKYKTESSDSDSETDSYLAEFFEQKAKKKVKRNLSNELLTETGQVILKGTVNKTPQPKCHSHRRLLNAVDNKSAQAFKNAHSNVCHKCNNQGELVMCDNCTLCFHHKCHNPTEIPDNDSDWYCHLCEGGEVTTILSIILII